MTYRVLRAMQIGTALAVATVASGDAWAADICSAVATRDIHAIENATSIIKKGQLDPAITQYRVNKLTGLTSFCSHGGYCYPTHIVAGGDRLEALKLTNCRVVSSKPDDDGDELTYEVKPIRTAISPEALRHDDLDNRFLNLGLCSACADNVTQYYLKQPSSQCAVLAKSALEGNPDALTKLQAMPEFCHWHY